MVQRAERAGAPALVFTVDLLGGSNRETMIRERVVTRASASMPPRRRAAARRERSCGRSRQSSQADLARYRAAHAHPRSRHAHLGIHRSPEGHDDDEGASIKGIVTREDARARRGTRRRRAVRVQSRRTGRELDAGHHHVASGGGSRVRLGKIPVICRRRLSSWHGHLQGAWPSAPRHRHRPALHLGTGAFGQEGVETVLAILRKEFELAMKQSGTTSIAKITRAHIVPR